ncbi:M15 family metallopeptidase [Flavobacterium coralii]|uniref:M15 family metallopeptidase n=1 Tax=Flavobacterium coralii TaxID=2838017 RepID=UPI000C49111F|nr:peptidoglycan L-alanyl-D-glutamate endopeptidase [Flavobacterium sp.]|tara:strand:- start:2646 stop:3176 length:531 start_codon:yes stop_codon:yes gene_type:complete
MDLITLDRIKLLHPDIRQEVRAGYEFVNNKQLGKGVRLRFAHTLRTPEEQNALYAQGRTKPGKVVTKAKAWQSIHNYGLAFDIVLLIDRDGNGTFETASWGIKADFDKDRQADWMEVVNYFKSIGFVWGGDWKSFKDYPHFEKSFGHTWRTLKAKYDKGDTFTEVIDGKTYTWVNL